jgi:deoxycytidylate deaminase
MIINAGIKEIYYRAGYADTLSEELLKAARIPLIQLQTING